MVFWLSCLFFCSCIPVRHKLLCTLEWTWRGHGHRQVSISSSEFFFQRVFSESWCGFVLNWERSWQNKAAFAPRVWRHCYLRPFLQTFELVFFLSFTHTHTRARARTEREKIKLRIRYTLERLLQVEWNKNKKRRVFLKNLLSNVSNMKAWLGSKAR